MQNTSGWKKNLNALYSFKEKRDIPYDSIFGVDQRVDQRSDQNDCSTLYSA